jgi:hypothetical protein
VAAVNLEAIPVHSDHRSAARIPAGQSLEADFMVSGRYSFLVCAQPPRQPCARIPIALRHDFVRSV